MKKLLTFLTLLTLFFGVGWAETETVDFSAQGYSNQQAITSYTGTNFSVTFYQGTNSNPPKYFTSGTAIRCYGGNQFSVKSSQKITSIVITFGSSDGSNTITTSDNNYSDGTWTGNANTVLFTIGGSNGNRRIKALTVTTGSGTAPTTYSITGTGTVTGGSVTASATSNITAGTSITITATPSTGYELSNLTVDNTDVTSSVSNNQYTFSMPAHDVAVSATFTEQSITPSTGILFERVTSLSSSDIGKRFIIVSESAGLALDDSGTNKNNGTSVTISSHSTTVPSNSNVGIFTLGNGTNGYTLAYSANDYMTLNSGSTTGLGHGSTATDLSITFDNDGNAIIANSRRIACYNNTDFRTYASWNSGQEVQLYKEVEEVAEVPDLFIIGQVNGNDAVAWNPLVGPQMIYINTEKKYSADVYCTGIGDNNEVGYSYFAFATELNNWDALNANNAAKRYGSGATGDWWGIGGTGESAFNSVIPLYKGSTKSYRLAPGLYTFTVDLTASPNSLTVTKRDVTMTISPSSSYFSDPLTVTLASNLTDLGGKIYYTTNDTEPSATNGTEYEGTFNLTETTTVKAIAVLGMIKSEVVEKTYTKTPAAPVITPASCTFNEPLTVTITAEEGATIYYTTDGSNPTEQSTQYTGPFTVSTTTTVKAKAYVNGVYGATATETYTYSNVQPSTGDFVLVTSADQLVAGNEYIIVASISGKALSTINTSDKKGTSTTDYELNGTLGESGSTIAPGNAVNILTLGGVTDAWTFQQNDDKYIVLPNSADLTTSNSGGTSGAKMAITITNNKAKIVGEISSTRQLCFRNTTSGVFANYASSNVSETSETYQNIYLYTRATNSVQPPVFSPIAGIYNVDIDVTISCATDGATIYYTTDGTEPSATNGTEYTGEIIVSESTTFKAIAVKGDNSSNVVTAAYTIQKSTSIETVTLDYREPFTAGIGKFFVTNNTGFSPVWTLDGNFGVKGTSYEPATGTNHAATSRLVSPIIDMTDAIQPEMTFSHQINNYFNDVTTQATLWIRETTNGTSGTWVQLPITFSDPAAAGGWTNDVVDINLSDYAGKKVQISFLYTNPTAGSGAGTWEIQNFVVADNSEYRMVNNIAEFLALENGTKAKFKNPVTVLYDYAQRGTQEYIWVKDGSGYMQFFLQPTLNSSTESALDPKAAYYENGDIIPAGFVVVKNYYENGKYVQAYSTESLDAGFELATQKGLADPDHYEFSTLNALTLSDADIAANCNRYITIEKIKIASKNSKNFTFADENGNVNACVGYNKYNGDGSLLKGGTTSADVTVPAVSNTYYNVKGIIQIWQGGWEFMPIEFTEWKVDEVTLRKLCADGVVNNEYKISNNLLGVYASEDGTKLWVKDDNGQSISPYAPDATYKDNFPINAEGNTRLDQALYDQSNWCEIQLTSENAGDFVGKIIKGGSIDGTFTNKTNPTITGVELTSDNIYSDGSYEPNYYIPCNFYGNQSCQTSQHGQPGHGDFFFMTPKPQEYAMVVWAIWDSENEQFVVNENPQYNSHGFKGSFKVDLSLNQNPNIALHDGMDDNFAYNFSAIIRVNSSKAGSDLMVYPLDLSAATDPATGINTVDVNGKAVKSVKYVNVAGIVSDVPFQGVNIVVTEYTDGSRTTTKMLKR